MGHTAGNYRMNPFYLRAFGMLAAGLAFTVAAQPTPVAEWDLDEGQGVQTVERVSGAEATLHGANWIAAGSDSGLQFNGTDAYVDGGAPGAADRRGALSLEVWVHPDQPAIGEPGIFGKWFDSFALTYYRGACWFYIGSGANKVHAPLPVGRWTHVVATFDGAELRLYLNGEKAGRAPSSFAEAPPGEHVYVGAIAPNASTPPTRFFAGKVGAAALFDRALTWREAADRFNAGADAYGLAPVDTAAFDTLGLRLFPYPERDELVARIDCSRVAVPRANATVELHLYGAASAPAPIALPELDDVVEVTLAPSSDAPTLRGVATLLVDGAAQSTVEATTPWRVPPAPLPAIDSYRAPPLPPAIMPPAYTAALDPDGAIAVTVDGSKYRVSSWYSYPDGGFNALGDAAPEGQEGAWNVAVEGDGLMATGATYRIHRRIVATPSRIEVSDEITNTTTEVIGIVQEHRLNGPEGALSTLQANPTVFLADTKHGVGLVPLDDVFYMRAENRMDGAAAVLADRHLGIPPGGTHTVRWAIYPTATTEYFDFINQVRQDEGINGHVPGGFAFTSDWDPISAEEVVRKGLGFYSWASITRVLQDPVISLEGWEFTDYPALCDRLRTWIADSRQANPDLQVTFHVAHSLFATNKPRELFPDSLAVDAEGNIDAYGGNSIEYYNRYFSPELVQDGWRWWLFYPTFENSFGKRMLAAADYMIQDLGATSVWADGYISGYVRGDYTYDHWDGVSVSIDPDTKRVTAKKALVPHTAMPVLKAVAQKYTDAGGYLITNGKPGPFSFTRLPVISSCETSGGDQQPIAQLHLGSTVTPLGNPESATSFQSIYDDALGKLDHGALYFWYNERDLITEPTLISYMYPITFESFHPGMVRGEERIVTKVSGTYGWPGDDALHLVHFFDARGRKRPHDFVTTVDEDGVRTAITLAEGESAVIEKRPRPEGFEGPRNLRLGDEDTEYMELGELVLPTVFTGRAGGAIDAEAGKASKHPTPSAIERNLAPIQVKLFAKD